MKILIVGNILKDVYLNLDSRTEKFEIDRNRVAWLDLSLDASKHFFFHRESSFGGAAVTLEVLQKLGLNAKINGSSLNFLSGESDHPAAYRYILVSDSGASYLAPSNFPATSFNSPDESPDFLFVDRSANLDPSTIDQISSFLELSPNTKLVIFLKSPGDQTLSPLVSRAALVFVEGEDDQNRFENIPPQKIIQISENRLKYQDITEKLSPSRVDIQTHLSLYSIASTTILGCFILGYSVEDSLKIARLNTENSRLNSVCDLEKLRNLAESTSTGADLELIAKNLLLKPKGILAADESGGSIHKKFEQLHIPDTYNNRRDYRNIFLSTPNLADYVNGVILFDETARQTADNGQNFVDFLTSNRIIPGIKVDQGLVKFAEAIPENYNLSTLASLEETWTKGLSDLPKRLAEYYRLGLRFAKWRAAFEIRLSETGEIQTPTNAAIKINCQILTKYALACQQAGLVPIVEPEVVYDGNYDIEKSAEITGRILDHLFLEMEKQNVNLRACILKTNMVLAGKRYHTQSTPEEIGQKTAEVLRNHVSRNLAGIVFLSGGQTPEQATENLAEVLKNGPFPWPLTFSFARALQDPALFAWAGDNQNVDQARAAFVERLKENSKAVS